MPPARVVSVAPGSPAALAGVDAGDEVVLVNGDDLRDVIAYQLHADGPRVELEVRRGGLERTLVVDKADGAPLGLELASAVFDRVRTCDNHCPFCFIYQLPKGMRKSLYLKDDDYRLSFLYGNFTTLTRFTEADMERVITERLGPLYVSIHATDPDVRTRLLRNRRGATSLRWLALLLDAGIEVHGQVVVCPGINDGPVLDETLLGVLDRFPTLATLGVVPLGVSAHNREPEMRPHTTRRSRGRRRHHRTLAGALPRRVGPPPRLRLRRVLPARAAAVPRARRLRRVRAARERDRHGSHVRGGGAGRARGRRDRDDRRAQRLLRMGRRRARRRLSRAADPVLRSRWWVAHGDGGRPSRHDSHGHARRAGARAVAARASRQRRAAARREPVLRRQHRRHRPPDRRRSHPRARRRDPGARYLLPDVALSRGRFLDGTTVDDLPHPVEIVATDGASLVAALRS